MVDVLSWRLQQKCEMNLKFDRGVCFLFFDKLQKINRRINVVLLFNSNLVKMQEKNPMRTHFLSFSD